MSESSHQRDTRVHPGRVADLDTPCFLVDQEKAQANATKMMERCKQLGVGLRPHMKTHKCLEAADMMTGATKRGIVVSSVKEAEFYADAGYDDILLASLFTANKIPRLQALSQQVKQFSVIVDNAYAVQCLEDNPAPDAQRWSVFLKVDCGGKRAGVLWDSEEAVRLAKRLTAGNGFTFRGLYVHECDSYKARGEKDIHAVASESTQRILHLAKRLKAEGIDCEVVSLGATPTASKPSSDMAKLTEIHPGNYIFYDMQQYQIGSCSLEEIAGRVATRVIGHYPHRKQLLVDCGWTALSQDGKGCLPGGCYCRVQHHPELMFTTMTQEVGFVGLPSDGQTTCDDFPLGTMLFLLPHHACATAYMHRQYFVHSGDTVTDVWQTCHGW